MVKRTIPSPRRESNPRTPIIQPMAQRIQFHTFPDAAYLEARRVNTTALYLFQAKPLTFDNNLCSEDTDLIFILNLFVLLRIDFPRIVMKVLQIKLRDSKAL
jgi:hypothetical protein